MGVGDTDFVTINVTAVNDASADIDNTVTTLEDTPANALAAVEIATLPVSQSLLGIIVHRCCKLRLAISTNSSKTG